jgi:Leucine-rich repeat (LRR) protein
MLRGNVVWSFLALSSAALAIALAGCPLPTTPGAMTVQLPPDDAEAVEQLKARGHVLETNEEGRVVRVTLVPTGNDELLELVSRLPNVERLKATGPNVTDAGLAHLAGHPRLRVLDLDQANVSNAGMAHLVSVPLVDINLKLTNVTDEGVAHLANIPTLKQLRLVKTNVTDAGVSHVQDMHELEWLDLQDVITVSNNCLPDVARCRNLRFLRVYGRSFEGEGIAPIGQMKSLRVLSMQQTGVGSPTYKPEDDNIHHLAGLVDLERLDLYGTFVNDASMAKLSSLTKLRDLSLRGTACGAVDMSYLASMPELRSLDLGESFVDDISMKEIGKLSNLEDLILWNTYVTNEGIVELEGKLTLKRLNLDNLKQVGDDAMDTVGKLVNLEYLHIGGTQVTDAGIAKLHGLKNLKKQGGKPALDIKSLGISDEAVEKLRDAIPALKEEGAIMR